MKRPLLVWLVFAGCAVTGLGVLAWFSAEMLRLERGAAQAREIAAREESVRLALWRMDSALAPIHGLEAARPPGDYDAFRAAGPVFTRDLVPAPPAAAMVPSPLLGYTPPFVRLHVQVAPDGRISSPQAPEGAARSAALRAAVEAGTLEAAAARLRILRERRTQSALAAALAGGPSVAGLAPEPTRDEAPPPPAAPAEVQRQASRELRKSVAEQQQRAEFVADNYYNRALAQEQRARSASPASSAPPAPGPSADDAAPVAIAAAPSVSWAHPARDAGRAEADIAAPAAKAARSADVPDPAPIEAMHAMWIDDELFLARRVGTGAGARVQAVWLDWPELRAWLLSRAADLLPEAALEPAAPGVPATVDEAARRLAFLPVRLAPGAIALEPANGWSPLRVSLAIAWSLAGVGVAALALLLAGTVRLSERRAAFVSAVTHELRTPLTTFRMYTEMLAGGMVADEARRRSYLDTLGREAARLSHLVENVLAYARIERGRASRRVEDTTPAALLSRMEERLRQRAEQGGLALAIDFAPGAADAPLRTDATALEQIVFNLVDNAAKYARRPEGGGQVRIDVATGGRSRLIVRVADDGPGIAPEMRRRLFRPFSKSAAEAAHSQPGVGLGLALSRRLARDELHGDLALERTGPEGTVFRLEV